MQIKIKTFKVIDIRISPLTRVSGADRQRTEAVPGNSNKFFRMMVARDGVEPPTPAFSELGFPVFPTTSMVAVGLLNTGRYAKDGWIVGDYRG